MGTFYAHEVYRQQLHVRLRGEPLWFPEPEPRNPDQRSGGEVQIGDVGYFDEGRFVWLFSVLPERKAELEDMGTLRKAEDMGTLRKAGDNIEGPPYSDEPLIFRPRLLQQRPASYNQGIMKTVSREPYIQTNVIVIPAGVGASFSFVRTSTAEAVLVLQQNADMTKVAPNNTFRDYVKKHHESWVQYARESLSLSHKPEEFVLVQGTMKTSNWTVAAFKQDSRSVKASFTGAFTPAGLQAGSVGFNVGLDQQNACQNESRSCLLSTGTILSDEPLSKDQWDHRLPHHEDDDGSAEDTQIISDSEPGSHQGPVDVVLDYILAIIAIACDDDITEMLAGDEWPSDLGRYLEEHLPDVDVDPETKRASLNTTLWYSFDHDS
ncbi:hypothetical protein NM688_g8240 [Phlebia brevispora]|uniref:Uncharacterized protein n=1 Tax=Phlebia brevispora TaxID=194682 RepID=A0ACC1RVH9_9APHY|nr:hypothetical protein NM688_g8240 [Phlebia brevispora]